VRLKSVTIVVNPPPEPLRGPWKAGPIELLERSPWPSDHPFLPKKEPTSAWTGSIYDAEGRQVVHHQAYGWRPTEQAWALLARAPELLEENERLREDVAHLIAGILKELPRSSATRLFAERLKAERRK
jgi:hypothetical protein